jgi:hypothetical protein
LYLTAAPLQRRLDMARQVGADVRPVTPLSDQELIVRQGARIERLGHALKLIRDGRCPCGGRFKWTESQTRCEQCDRHQAYGYGYATEIAKEALDA